jgi:DNA repair protein RadA/Sms
MSRRLTEAARLGFTRAIVPTHSQSGAANKAPAGLTVQTASTLSEALDLAQLSIKK